MSYSSQKGAISIIAAMIRPSGFSSILSVILPFDSKATDRVTPQEGQAIPVAFLKRQGVNVS